MYHYILLNYVSLGFENKGFCKYKAAEKNEKEKEKKKKKCVILFREHVKTSVALSIVYNILSSSSLFSRESLESTESKARDMIYVPFGICSNPLASRSALRRTI